MNALNGRFMVFQLINFATRSSLGAFRKHVAMTGATKLLSFMKSSDQLFGAP